MFPQKTCLKLSFLLAFFSLPVLAQSYSHEFENPDGSSHLCTSDFSGNTGKTRCVKVPLDERIKHQKNLLRQTIKSVKCAQLDDNFWIQQKRNLENGDYLEWPSMNMYRECMAK